MSERFEIDDVNRCGWAVLLISGDQASGLAGCNLNCSEASLLWHEWRVYSECYPCGTPIIVPPVIANQLTLEPEWLAVVPPIHTQ